MDFTYLLVGLGAFLVASSRASAATPQGQPQGQPQQPQGQIVLQPPNTTLPLEQRVPIIQSLWQNQIPKLDYVRYALHIGQRESGSNYRPTHRGALSMGYPLGMNDHGYAGMYQMGASALETQGYIKAGTCARKGTGGNHQILTTLENWTDKCPNGLEQFMNTPAIQEEAMLKMTRGNYRVLRSMKIINDDTPAPIKAGYLAAAHLKGPGGAAALAEGNVLVDGYGTSTDNYYRGGVTSQVA